MTDLLLRFGIGRRVAWFLADRSIMRETLEEGFKRRLLRTEGRRDGREQGGSERLPPVKEAPSRAG